MPKNTRAAPIMEKIDWSAQYDGQCLTGYDQNYSVAEKKRGTL
jgi:hypothetical protein